MDNMKYYEAFRAVPENAKKTIAGGKLKGMTDINPMWRIKALTEMFGPCGIGWYYEVDNKWTEIVAAEVAVFVDIKLYVKADGEWSKPIHGTGGSKLASSTKNGIEMSDECYKMATTDALSVACKQLGIGADVYWDKDKTKYSAPAEEKNEDKAIEEAKLKAQVMKYINDVKMSPENIEKLCKLYKIEKLADMTGEMAKHYLSKLEEKKHE